MPLGASDALLTSTLCLLVRCSWEAWEGHPHRNTTVRWQGHSGVLRAVSGSATGTVHECTALPDIMTHPPARWDALNPPLLHVALQTINTFVSLQSCAHDCLLHALLPPQVTKTVDKNSKEVQQAAERQQPVKSGLDAFLAEVEKKRKVG